MPCLTLRSFFGLSAHLCTEFADVCHFSSQFALRLLSYAEHRTENTRVTSSILRLDSVLGKPGVLLNNE